MTLPVVACASPPSSWAAVYSEGTRASFAQSLRFAGDMLSMVEATHPAGDMSAPAVPDFVMFQDLHGGSRISADHGAGRCEMLTERGGFAVNAPDFSVRARTDASHYLRSFAFPRSQWDGVLDEASEGRFSFEALDVYRGTYNTPSIVAALRKLWSITADECTASRLLTRAAGCEIFAELCRLGGAALPQTRGGLAPWAERRSMELIRAKLSEDISLDELASEAKLSVYHFARMFKQSVGVPPRVYLTRLRMEKACDLLENTDLTITQIALEVGYSSNQALARVFMKNLRMNPTDYRRAAGLQNHNSPSQIYG